MWLVIDAYISNSSGEFYAVVELDRERAQTLLDYAKTAEGHNEEEFRHVAYWFSFALVNAEGLEATKEFQEATKVGTWDNVIAVMPEVNVDLMGAECGTVMIEHDCCTWYGWLKHTDDRIDTPDVPYEVIKGVLEKL